MTSLLFWIMTFFFNPNETAMNALSKANGVGDNTKISAANFPGRSNNSSLAKTTNTQKASNELNGSEIGGRKIVVNK